MLAELISARMQTLGIKQRRLAMESGVSTAQISMILSKQVFNLTAETAGKLARVLGIPAEQVFAAALADVRAAELATQQVAERGAVVPGTAA